MKLGRDLRLRNIKTWFSLILQLVSLIMYWLTVVRKHKSIYGLRKRQKVILRGQNVLSKVSWEAHLGPSPLQKNFQTPDPHSRINQLQSPCYFNAMIMLLGPFTKVRLWPSSLVVSPQKRATVTQETAEATDKHARLDGQAHGPFPWGNGGRKNGGHQRRGISAAKPAVLSLA